MSIPNIFLKKNIFWFITLVAILSFYLIERYKVDSLFKKNEELDKEVIMLQKELSYLDSLLLSIKSNFKELDPLFRYSILTQEGTQVRIKFLPNTKNAQHRWNFGDGNSSTEVEPTNTYTIREQDTSEFIVKHVISRGNLKDSSTKVIKLSPVPAGGITFNLNRNVFYRCDDSLYKFNTVPSGGIVKDEGVVPKVDGYYFRPSDIKSKNRNITFSYNVLNTTVNYTVTLRDISASFSHDSAAYSRGLRFTFTAKEKNMDEYTWELKDNNNSENNNTGHDRTFWVFQPLTGYNFTVTLTAVKKSGCKDTHTEHFPKQPIFR